MQKNRYKWYKLYWYSQKLGWKSLLRSPFFRLSYIRILVPMDIQRYFELPETAKYVGPKPGERILDISSPKLLTLYLAEKTQASFVGIDIFQKEINDWKRLIKLSDGSQNLKNLKLEVGDATSLKFPDNYFDKIFSVSVVEHIPKDGDNIALKEMARVLKKGGRVVLTVPFGNRCQNIWVNKPVYGNQKIEKNNNRVFFMRIYDEKMLYEKIIKNSGLKLIKKEICNETIPFFSHLHSILLPFSAIFGFTYPFLAKLSLRSGSRLRTNNKYQHHANILLVLEK